MSTPTGRLRSALENWFLELGRLLPRGSVFVAEVTGASSWCVLNCWNVDVARKTISGTKFMVYNRGCLMA